MSSKVRTALVLVAALSFGGAGGQVGIATAATTTAGEATPGAATTPTTTTPETSTTPTTPTPPPKPSPRTKVTQLPKSVVTDGTVPLRVRLSGPPAPNSQIPTLSPSVAGKWKAAGTYETFIPTSTLQPCSSYTLTVWAGTDATGDRPLGKARTVHFRVVCPGVLALQQALGRLGYLPYTVHASRGVNSGHARESRAKAAHYAFDPPRGLLLADVADAPGLFYEHFDPTTRGALMVFQQARNLAPTGVADSRTWASLLATETHGSEDPRPYTFVTVGESIPETLDVHQGSHIVLSTPANTGVAGATTEQGTFPIYARYTSTTMSGTNPDGSKYVDPGVPWVNYFNGGDAVHGFPRPSYGTPQSNGCVELPIETAQRVFGMLSIGDLVIVS
ncbi:MAG TPA: L,D-transpeptidase family protein [Solirubrobacteraceae bacterium]|nr:L,D-transpeptidase family protein [Solirubrobacteraceae bacterium]